METNINILRIDNLKESPTNPRRSFGDIGELADSIREQGILSPLRVRPSCEESVYEVIFGSRRLRAARNIGLEEIPCIVTDASDDQVMEMQLVENSQRADVHPMDEAEGYQRLVKFVGPTDVDPVSAVAKKTGKTAAHVRRRLKLLALPADARKAFKEGVITQEIAVQIARLPDVKIREAVTKDILKGESTAEFGSGDWHNRVSAKDVPGAAAVAELIRKKYLLRLKGAPFPTGQIGLVKDRPACKDCESRTGNQSDLFGDVENDDLCTLPDCFARKRSAAWNARAKVAKKKGIEVIEGKKAKEICPYGNLHGFVKPNDKDYSDAKSRTYRQILGQHKPKTYLIRTERWEIIEAWKDSDVDALMKKHGLRKTYRSSSGSGGSSMAEERRRKAIEKETRTRALTKCVEHVEKKNVKSDEFLSIVVDILAEEFSHQSREVLFKRRGVKSMSKVLATADTIDKTRGLAVELLVGNPAEHWCSARPLEKFCRHFGIDQGAIKTEVRKEFQPKKKQPKKKTKKRSTPSKSKA